MGVLGDRAVLAAVAFDLDGVLIDSEQLWDDVRRELAAERGRPWPPGATGAMLGMSSGEWSRYLHEVVGVPGTPEELGAEVVRRLGDRYRARLPLLPGATDAVRRLARTWPLGLASSSNRPIIDLVLETSGLTGHFRAVVSSEEVGRGKPAPDVYLEVARRLGVPAAAMAAIEDSGNGIRSAVSAGMAVVAIPNAHFPPPAEVLGLAGALLPSVADLTGEVVLEAWAARGR